VATVLALDVGSSSVRAQGFDDRAEPVDDLRKEEYEGGDPDEIVSLVRKAIDGRDEDATAIGSSCFGHSLIALDAAGKPLTPVLGWRDTRSGGAAEWLRRRVDPAAVQARTGAHVHPSFWPAKLVWLAQTEPDVFRGAARFVSFCDYLYEQLLGVVPSCSLSIASGTGLLDLNEQRWDAALLELLSLDESRLPRISGDPQDTWYPAVIDGACSNLGAGCTGRARCDPAAVAGQPADERPAAAAVQPLTRSTNDIYRRRRTPLPNPPPCGAGLGRGVATGDVSRSALCG